MARQCKLPIGQLLVGCIPLSIVILSNQQLARFLMLSTNVYSLMSAVSINMTWPVAIGWTGPIRILTR